MKKLFALFLSLFTVAASFTIQATPSDSSLPQENPKGELTKKAEFNGDGQTVYQWIGEHIILPEQAVNMGVSGKIVIGLTIRKDGSVGDIYVREGLYPLMDAEMIRLFGSMPNWNPGIKDDVAVNSFLTFPMKVNKEVKPFKIDYPLLDITDLSDMLTDALQYLISHKYMGDLKIGKGKVKDNEGEVLLELSLKQKPEWWDEKAADGTLDQKLFRQTVWPMSYDFKTACKDKGVIVKCSIKPDKSQKPYEFEVKGDLWEYMNYDPSKTEQHEESDPAYTKTFMIKD